MPPILDAGDQVVITREGWSAQQAQVLMMDDDGDYTLAALGGNVSGLILHMKRSELIRCDGDLQVGDFVKVEGEVRAQGVVEWSSVSWDSALITGCWKGTTYYIAPLHRAVQYEVRRRALTRIAKSEVQI